MTDSQHFRSKASGKIEIVHLPFRALSLALILAVAFPSNAALKPKDCLFFLELFVRQIVKPTQKRDRIEVEIIEAEIHNASELRPSPQELLAFIPPIQVYPPRPPAPHQRIRLPMSFPEVSQAFTQNTIEMISSGPRHVALRVGPHVFDLTTNGLNAETLKDYLKRTKRVFRQPAAGVVFAASPKDLAILNQTFLAIQRSGQNDYNLFTRNCSLFACQLLREIGLGTDLNLLERFQPHRLYQASKEWDSAFLEVDYLQQ